MATQEIIVRDKNGVVVSDTTTQIADAQVDAQVIAAAARAEYENNLTYLALPAPDAGQAVAQVTRLTFQINYLIKTAFQAYDL